MLQAESVLSSSPHNESSSEKLSSRPFQYLSAVKIGPKTPSGSIVAVKACVVTLIGGMSIKEGPLGTGGGRTYRWHLRLLITDGSATIDASLSSKVIEKWLGTCPMKYMSMTDEEKMEVRKVRIKSVADKLLMLNAIMKICFTYGSVGGDGAEQPEAEIIEVIELNRGHAQQLKVRQK